MDDQNLSKLNSEFWNTLCGSHLAKSLGIHDSSPESLKKFDDWYFDFYPYLYQHIPFHDFKDKRVLEIGLGYGTVCQKIGEAEAQYTGLDIAQGPVDMANHRLKMVGAQRTAIQGSILSPPLDPESFDYIVAIGCLHHTGNLELAIQNCYQLLRKGGVMIFMVYYAYSYRRYRMSRFETLRYMRNEILHGYRGVVPANTTVDRAAYDTDSDGKAAPHTDWISIKSLKYLCRNYRRYNARLENIDQESPFSRITRKTLLRTPIPRFLGLDLYVRVEK